MIWAYPLSQGFFKGYNRRQRISAAVMYVVSEEGIVIFSFDANSPGEIPISSPDFKGLALRRLPIKVG